MTITMQVKDNGLVEAQRPTKTHKAIETYVVSKSDFQSRLDFYIKVVQNTVRKFNREDCPERFQWALGTQPNLTVTNIDLKYDIVTVTIISSYYNRKKSGSDKWEKYEAKDHKIPFRFLSNDPILIAQEVRKEIRLVQYQKADKANRAALVAQQKLELDIKESERKLIQDQKNIEQMKKKLETKASDNSQVEKAKAQRERLLAWEQKKIENKQKATLRKHDVPDDIPQDWVKELL